jgi:hypothetical protein
MERVNAIRDLDLDLPFIGITLGLSFIVYLSSLLLYRVFFHPLRHVPGPLLARLTYGYQIYYDAFLGGVMPKNMPRLHQKYGPIVRIAPDRVHINDPEFYKRFVQAYHKMKTRANTILRVFGSREDFIKSKYYYGNLGISESIVTMQDVKAHRILRNALNPFFTPQTAVDQHPIILQEIEMLLYDLRRPHAAPVLIDLQEYLGRLFVSSTVSCLDEYADCETGQRELPNRIRPARDI